MEWMGRGKRDRNFFKIIFKIPIECKGSCYIVGEMEERNERKLADLLKQLGQGIRK